jgi:hypothetical protein
MPAALLALAFSIAAAAGAPQPAEPVCAAPPPVPGQVLHGPVLHVPDAATVCIATGPAPSDWVAAPIERAAPSRGLLMAAAFGQNATCRVADDGRAVCTIEGVSLARRLQQPEVERASAIWR